LLDRYGVETVDAAIIELKAGSERLMRAYRQHPGRDLFGDRDCRQ
jgi:hypothetical protein